MSESVISLHGDLLPGSGLTVDVSTDSFDLHVDDESILATARTPVSLDEARARLKAELNPLLVVVAADGGIA